jgi:hypothetical protein
MIKGALTITLHKWENHMIKGALTIRAVECRSHYRSSGSWVRVQLAPQQPKKRHWTSSDAWRLRGRWGGWGGGGGRRSAQVCVPRPAPPGMSIESPEMVGPVRSTVTAEDRTVALFCAALRHVIDACTFCPFRRDRPSKVANRLVPVDFFTFTPDSSITYSTMGDPVARAIGVWAQGFHWATRLWSPTC